MPRISPRGPEAFRRGDYATALREFRPLAEQGFVRAQFNLELMYFKGEGVPEDDFAIKGALVRGFLDIHGVAYHRQSSNAKLAPERLAELARGFTVAVHCWE